MGVTSKVYRCKLFCVGAYTYVVRVAHTKGEEDQESSIVLTSSHKGPVRMQQHPSTVITGTHNHVRLVHGCWGLELSYS